MFIVIFRKELLEDDYGVRNGLFVLFGIIEHQMDEFSVIIDEPNRSHIFEFEIFDFSDDTINPRALHLEDRVNHLIVLAVLIDLL
jgi:hypothetical protein